MTLSDAPEEVINTTTRDLNYLVVHQQDIQAVVNAMWKGGATAVTVQGQRVVTTTGIKCEGNAVQLQGVPYSQPYVISAVGDQAALLDAIDSDPYLQVYREQAADPDISVGWDLQLEDSITAPAYDGLLDLNYAKPLALTAPGPRGSRRRASRGRPSGWGVGGTVGSVGVRSATPWARATRSAPGTARPGW